MCRRNKTKVSWFSRCQNGDRHGKENGVKSGRVGFFARGGWGDWKMRLVGKYKCNLFDP